VRPRDALSLQGRHLVPDGPALMPGERISEALQKLEERLKDRDYLAEEYSLAEIAHADNFVRLRELEERGEVSLDRYPNVEAWMERLENYKAAV
jgi:glutathione S-transferase